MPFDVRNSLDESLALAEQLANEVDRRLVELERLADVVEEAQDANASAPMSGLSAAEAARVASLHILFSKIADVMREHETAVSTPMHDRVQARQPAHLQQQMKRR